MAKNHNVDQFIGQSKLWSEEMARVRPIFLRCGLTEHIKWGKPCYCHEHKNVVILQTMMNFLSLMFFKGALLNDNENVLEEQGPNSRSARRVRITSVDDVDLLRETIKKHVNQAMDIEKAGRTVSPSPTLALVAELQQRIDRDSALRVAFEALTPGRQREYNLYFSGAKQAKTRSARIERFVPKILAGKSMRER